MSMRRTEIRKEAFSLAVVLTTLIVVISQFFYYEAIGHPQKEIKTEQAEDQSDDQLYISPPSTSLPSSFHVELNQTLIFLFEIVFEKEEAEERDFGISLPPNGFFKTLFDGVISPNAP